MSLRPFHPFRPFGGPTTGLDAPAGYVARWRADTITGSPSAWQDMTGNYTLVPVSTAPTLSGSAFGGRPSVHLVGQGFRAASLALSAASTVLSVVRIDTADFTKLFTHENQRVEMYGGPPTNMYAGSNGPGGSLVAGTSYVVACVFSGASSKLRRNGVETIGNPGSDPGTGNFYVCSNVGGSNATGYLAEMVLYTGPLSAASLLVWESYAKQRYAISF